MIRMVLLHNLLQGSSEITDQRAADAARIHLRDLDAGVLQEPAIDANLTKFIFDQDNLLSRKHFLDQLLDQRGLACAEKP